MSPRHLLLQSCLLAAALCGLLPLAAQGPAGKQLYQIEFDPAQDVAVKEGDLKGTSGLYVHVKFAITLDGNQVSGLDDQFRLVIEENGRRVEEVQLPQPTVSEDLSVLLAIDTSGSMREHGRMPQAREAAATFLRKLPAAAECGLILFDHQIREQLPPGLSREPLLQKIRAVEPRGGTAYLDAAFESVKMLAGTPAGRERGVVLMTDGIDLNSSKTIDEVIREAKARKVRVYTVGIGEPGRLDKVSTALVLDRSGSMQAPADDRDRTPKIAALHLAGSRFVNSISSVGRVSLIEFSTLVNTPQPFSNQKRTLARSIERLVPDGETALFDATYTGIATLEADGSTGKRAVVAMTDGIDNSSRRRVEEVIARAREAKIPLYVLGFGREGELDQKTMSRMAEETGGKYYHARNKDALLEIFENLSIDLHDEGIDEKALKELADRTGGQYFPAKNVSDLKFILERVSTKLQRQVYEVTFRSLNQRRDGTQRDVALKLLRRSSSGQEEVTQERQTQYQTGGLIVAEMNPLVYVALLTALAALAIAPMQIARNS